MCMLDCLRVEMELPHLDLVSASLWMKSRIVMVVGSIMFKSWDFSYTSELE
jgi:hypothetical protein